MSAAAGIRHATAKTATFKQNQPGRRPSAISLAWARRIESIQMFTITKQFAFSASHQLAGLDADHPCSRLHGHNYIVEVELRGASLGARGFVRDYRELGPLKTMIDDVFDHRHLNDVLGHDHPTAERLALFFYDWTHDRWPEVTAVRVSETPKTWAEYRP
ncbi:6-pyruvoyl trahydropterin synthase family protein [Thalassospira alkalitolerans]|uniref:6-pyruvoyl trahydropterin synthase family protein n=1 Tax=Thalassospira alkalitolerans TaxID=1293890 RepID=UPI003AA9154D